MTASITRLRFSDGLRSLPRACGILLRAPKILLWLMPPLLITLLLDILAFHFAFGWLREWIKGLLPQGGYFFWLEAALGLLAAAAVVFLLGWSFVWLFLLLASPFQDYISAAVEKETRGFAGSEPEGFGGFLGSMAQSALQAIVLTALTVLFLVVGFVPVLGAIVFFLWSAFALGYSFVAIPSGRMAHRLAERLSFSQRNLGAVMALGIVVASVSLVPLLNVLFMPIFVIAGTLLYLDATHADAGSPGNANASGQD